MGVKSDMCRDLLEQVRKAQADFIELRDACRDFVETSVESPLVFDVLNYDFFPSRDEDSVILSEFSPFHLRYYDRGQFTHRSEFYPVAIIPRDTGASVIGRIYDERKHSLSKKTWEFSVEDVADPEELLTFILRTQK